MKLYVANGTRQSQELYYRLDFNFEGNPVGQNGAPAAHQTIASGKQQPIGGELKHISQAESIIRQIERFGAISADQANRQTQFAPYVYSVDKPVSAKTIQKVFDQNQAFLSKDGAIRREKAAIAATELIPTAQKVTIGTEQVSESEYGGPDIAEGVELDRTVGRPSPDGEKGHRPLRFRPQAA
jgi:hypothetical protein